MKTQELTLLISCFATAGCYLTWGQQWKIKVKSSCADTCFKLLGLMNGTMNVIYDIIKHLSTNKNDNRSTSRPTQTGAAKLTGERSCLSNPDWSKPTWSWGEVLKIPVWVPDVLSHFEVQCCSTWIISQQETVTYQYKSCIIICIPIKRLSKLT